MKRIIFIITLLVLIPFIVDGKSSSTSRSSSFSRPSTPSRSSSTNKVVKTSSTTNKITYVRKVQTTPSPGHIEYRSVYYNRTVYYPVNFFTPRYIYIYQSNPKMLENGSDGCFKCHGGNSCYDCHGTDSSW